MQCSENVLPGTRGEMSQRENIFSPRLRGEMSRRDRGGLRPPHRLPLS